MRRIVMFTNTYRPMVGGLERSVENAHEDLNQSGHLCRVVTPESRGAESSQDGVLRVPALKGVGERDFSLPLPATAKIEHWMEAIEPHILHAHQPFLLGEAAWRLSRIRRIPLLFSNHTLYERYAHLLRMDMERARRLVIDLTTRYANRCQLVIAPTVSVRSVLLERGIEAPIEVVPSGIDWDFYAGGSRLAGRAHFGFGPDDEVVGHLGRLSQEKNLRFLVESVILLMKARERVKFFLVGDGDRLEWARERFAVEQLAERLICPGLLSGTVIADAYAAMDVFAFASLSDTQGLVLAEAMAARLAVVALDATGVRDCVSDGKTGRVLPSTTTEEHFARAIAELLADKRRLTTLAMQAHEDSRRFSRARCLKSLLAAYDRVLKEYRPPGDESADQRGQLTERLDAEWAPLWQKMTAALRLLS